MIVHGSCVDWSRGVPLLDLVTALLQFEEPSLPEAGFWYVDARGTKRSLLSRLPPKIHPTVPQSGSTGGLVTQSVK
jgi:hypothetical protein